MWDSINFTTVSDRVVFKADGKLCTFISLWTKIMERDLLLGPCKLQIN